MGLKAEFGMGKEECGRGKGECGRGNAEGGMWNAEREGLLKKMNIDVQL